MLKQKMLPKVFRTGTNEITEGSKVTFFQEGVGKREGALIFIDGKFFISTKEAKLFPINNEVGGVFENTIQEVVREAVVS